LIGDGPECPEIMSWNEPQVCVPTLDRLPIQAVLRMPEIIIL
jgi:hypothetical protein